MLDFEKFAKEVVGEILEDEKPLIILKNPNAHSIDDLINALRSNIESRGKSLNVVHHDSPELRSLSSLNGTIYLAVDNNCKPEEHTYLIDVDWVMANYK